MMTMILKDVAKVPLARIIYDGTEWYSSFQLFLDFVIVNKKFRQAKIYSETLSQNLQFNKK